MLDTVKTHQPYKTFINMTWRQIWGKALELTLQFKGICAYICKTILWDILPPLLQISEKQNKHVHLTFLHIY